MQCLLNGAQPLRKAPPSPGDEVGLARRPDVSGAKIRRRAQADPHGVDETWVEMPAWSCWRTFRRRLDASVAVSVLRNADFSRVQRSGRGLSSVRPPSRVVARPVASSPPPSARRGTSQRKRHERPAPFGVAQFCLSPVAQFYLSLDSEGSQRRNGHDQEYPRSGMDSGDGGGLTGHDAQAYAAHISP